MKATEMKSGSAKQHEALWFSIVLTKRRCEISTTSESGETVWGGFHRFTRVITTTRLQHSIFQDNSLAEEVVVVDFAARAQPKHISTALRDSRALYFAKKRVEYVPDGSQAE